MSLCLDQSVIIPADYCSIGTLVLLQTSNIALYQKSQDTPQSSNGHANIDPTKKFQNVIELEDMTSLHSSETAD